MTKHKHDNAEPSSSPADKGRAPRSVAELQRFRLRRVLMATCTAYLCMAIFVVGFHFGGVLALVPTAVFLIAVVAINLFWLGLIVSGANLRFAEPSLTGPQVITSLWPSIYVMYHLERPEGRTVFLLMAIVATLFGTFVFDFRRMLKLCAVVLSSYLILLVAMAIGAPQRIDLRVEVVIAIAYAIVLTLVGFLGSHVVGLRRAVRDRNKRLEQSMVALQEAQDQLVDTARQAGKAEVATGILHNVGNVINSVNISAEVVTQWVRGSSVELLGRLVELIQTEGTDPAALCRFLTEDRRGKRLPEALSAVAGRLNEERDEVCTELRSLQQKVRHVIAVVASQQEYARCASMRQAIDVDAFVDRAIALSATVFSEGGARVRREYSRAPRLVADPHKLMQILVNLLTNARQALARASHTDRTIDVRTRTEGDLVAIEVADNGVGIAPEHFPRLFTHGFTTKSDGHGFGLHMSALAAEDLGGSLAAFSDGPGLGATFKLLLPAASERASS